MPPGSLFFCHAAPDRAGRDLLTLRVVAQENLPNLEKRDIAMATVGVALRRRDQTWQQRRPELDGMTGGGEARNQAS
jgi:hypothetical protein